jgi:hypothetical protein
LHKRSLAVRHREETTGEMQTRVCTITLKKLLIDTTKSFILSYPTGPPYCESKCAAALVVKLSIKEGSTAPAMPT